MVWNFSLLFRRHAPTALPRSAMPRPALHLHHCLQDAGRRVSFYTLSHVLGLDLQFHLDRKTGECVRLGARKTRGA